METIFRAIDGAEFFDEDDCFDYEQELLAHKYANDIIFLTNDYTRCSLSPINAIECCSYMYLNTNKPDKYISELLENAELPIQKGLYYYDYRTDHWKNAELRIHTLELELEKFQKVKKIINECVE